MKIVLIAFAALAASSPAFAAKKACTYTLDQEEYWEDASGELAFKGRTFRCETFLIGQDMLTLCKDKNKLESPNYDLIVAFDGAEADFGVYDTLDFKQGPLCFGQAVNK